MESQIHCRESSPPERLPYEDVRKGESLSPAVFEQLIADLIACTPATRSVVFSGGGEPSVHPFLPAAIHRLCDAGIDVGVITNGAYVSAELLDAYTRCHWVRVSLDTPYPEPYFRMISPHQPDNFEKVISNARAISCTAKASSSQLTLGLAFILTRQDQSDAAIIRCLELAAEVGADYVMYRPLVGTSVEQIDRTSESFRLALPLIDACARSLGVAHQFHKFIAEFDKTVNQKVTSDTRQCPVVQDGLVAFIAATGDVLPCYAIYQHQMSPRWSYGNLNDKTFAEIWRASLRKSVVDRIDTRKCPYCRFQGHNRVLRSIAGGTVNAYSADSADPHFNFL